MSRQSRLSTNDKGDNEMKTGAVHRSAGIYFMTEQNSRQPQLRDSLMKAVQPVIASINGRITQHIREAEGRKKGKDRVGHDQYFTSII